MYWIYLSVCGLQEQHASLNHTRVDVFCFTKHLIWHLHTCGPQNLIQFYLSAPALFYLVLNNWSVSSAWISALTWSVSLNLMTALMQSQSRQQTRKVIEIHCFWMAVISLQVRKGPVKNLFFFKIHVGKCQVSVDVSLFYSFVSVSQLCSKPYHITFSSKIRKKKEVEVK